METFEELVERYMRCDKKTLAELLALKDMCYPQTPKINEPYQPQPWQFPSYPYCPWQTPTIWCSNSTMPPRTDSNTTLN